MSDTVAMDYGQTFGDPDMPDRSTNDEFVMYSDPLGYQEVPPIGYGASSIAPEHRHPYVPYKCSPVRRIVNGTPDSFPLDFKANSLRVDNYSPQFLYIDSANFWVPPGTVGWILKCVQASDEGRAYWAAPAGVTQPAPVTGALAVLMWLEESLDFQSGIELTTVAVSTVTGATAGGASLGSPPAANVLTGSTGRSAPGTGTILTIPAGRTWVGTVIASVSASNDPVTASSQTSAFITTGGAGVTPAAGSLGEIDVDLPATVTGALSGVSTSETVVYPGVVIIAPTGNTVTLGQTVNAFGGATPTNYRATAAAYGLLQ